MNEILLIAFVIVVASAVVGQLVRVILADGLGTRPAPVGRRPGETDPWAMPHDEVRVTR